MLIKQIHRLLVFILCGIAFCGITAAAGKAEKMDFIQLWPADSGMADPNAEDGVKPDKGDGHIRVTNVKNPTLQVFPASGKTGPSPAVILCPGGGYSHLVITKMTPTAKWLNERGISAFILRYRTPKKREEAFMDAQRAMRIVRSRAAEWNIDPEQIGIMGSSAGGHLAARVSTGSDIKAYQPIDEVDQVSCRPDFTVLLYPAYMNDGDKLKNEFALSAELPPTLIISAEDDIKFFHGSEVYAEALEDAGASIRFHSFKEGGHGFDMNTEKDPLCTWPDLLEQWLKDIGVLKKEAQ
jgi:acetyl esterase/lipase